MDNEILFSERQKFKQWWLWTLLLGANVFCLYRIFNQAGGQKVEHITITNPAPLINFGLTLLLTILIMNLRLETQIKSDGIYVRFFPFHFSFRHYTWNKIAKSFVRQYNPIGEYGGWGLRLGLFGKGKAFNVSGDKGLQLEFSNNKKLLIGTNKPDELIETLYKIGRLKE